MRSTSWRVQCLQWCHGKSYVTRAPAQSRSDDVKRLHTELLSQAFFRVLLTLLGKEV